MKHIKYLGISVAVAFLASTASSIAETGGPMDWLKISNLIIVEYDDNIYEEETNAQDTMKIIDELNLTTVLDWDKTFLTLRYTPSFVWWSDREPDDTDLHHTVDATLRHEFSPRATLTLKNLLRIAELPEETSRGVFVRGNSDYLYNESAASLDLAILPRTHLVVGGRYTILDYDNEATSIGQDRDIIAFGATLRYTLSPKAGVMADYRREEVGYDFQETADLRDSVSDYIGLGYEQVAGDFVGLFRAGYQRQSYENSSIEDDEQPYGDVTITYVFSPRTRVSASAAYSMLESEQGGFAGQDRTVFTGSFNHDLTAKIALGLSASYLTSEYTADKKIVADGGPDSGEEEILQFGARAAYRINQRNSIELNYSYIDFTSDLQRDFDRNRFGIGWRLDI